MAGAYNDAPTGSDFDVLVLGAGMAGLAAARALAERGVRVCVLESQQRVGGRVRTETVAGATVELGAEFVHGRPPELFALIAEAGLTLTERDGAMLRATEAHGVWHIEEDNPQDGSMFAALEKLDEPQGDDEPFARWLARQDVGEEERAALLGFVEGFNAADAERIGVYALAAQQHAEDAIEGDRAWHVNGGYAQVAEYLATQIRALGSAVRTGQHVAEIAWQHGSVRLRTAAGEEYAAPRCIVTLPLALLQRVNAGGMAIMPEPPYIALSRSLAMGQVVRFTLLFQSRWWEKAKNQASDDALRTLHFLFTPSLVPAVWWTAHPEAEPEYGPFALVGWVGGPRSSELAGKSADELGALACAQLGEVFGVGEDAVRAQLVTTVFHDWSADPLARGAYSYVPAGALDVPRALSEPLEATLYFAGEHTDVTAHWGTVHAAMRSGLRAAAQILGDAV
jgi:monoamine oxidase